MTRHLMIAACIVTVLGTAVAAHARLGESATQCQERYGEPIDTADGGPLTGRGYVYQTGEYMLIIVYKDGRAWQIAYAKRSEGGKGNEQVALTEKEMKTFMEENGEGLSWERSNVAGLKYFWTRQDSKATASYQDTAKFLYITQEN